MARHRASRQPPFAALAVVFGLLLAPTSVFAADPADPALGGNPLGSSKNRRKLSAMCEHKRECLGSPRCPAMLPTKVSGR